MCLWFEKNLEAYERAYIDNPNVDRDDLVVLMGITYNDIFDPNSSIKANRGVVWIKTITFLSQLFSQNKVEDTYTISIGFKNSSHDYFELKLYRSWKI